MFTQNRLDHALNAFCAENPLYPAPPVCANIRPTYSLREPITRKRRAFDAKPNDKSAFDSSADFQSAGSRPPGEQTSGLLSTRIDGVVHMRRKLGLLLLLLAFAGLGVDLYGIAHAAGATPPSNSAAYEQGRAIGKYAAPVVIALLALVVLGRTLLGNRKPAAPPTRRPSVRGMTPPGDPSLRGGQNTFASNPARLQLSASQWPAANPWVPVVAACIGVIGIILLFVKVAAGIVFLLTAGIFMVREIKHAKQKFFMGDVCPGVVISAQHNLVGVFTDLVAGGNVPRPAIKILKQPLHRMTPEPAYDGMRVATVALYWGNVRRQAWQDFMPEVINCVIRDPEKIARVFGSISEQQWQALDTYLSQVPEARPGLYRMWNLAPAASGQVPAEATYSAGRPWYRSTSAIIVFAVCGSVVGLMLAVALLGSLSRNVGFRRSGRGPVTSPAPPPMPQVERPVPPPPSFPPGPPRPTQAGPYTVGASVSANWAGRWTPGKIASINPGGFTVMVQLEDQRFPQPIGLPTNQIRLR